MNNTNKGILLVLLSAAGFGLMPVFASYAYATGLNVPTLLFLRFIIGAIILFGYLSLARKKWVATRKDLALFFLLGGVLYALQAFGYFSAIRYMPVPLVALILYLYPVFVAVISHFVNKEHLSKKVVWAIAVSLLGMALVLGRPGGNVNLTGLLYALGAAVVYSSYIIIGNRVALNAPPLVASSFIVLFASIPFLVSGALTGSLQFRFPAMGWPLVLGVGSLSTALPIFCFLRGMNATGPTRASIVSMLEPVVTIAAAAVLLGQRMSVVQAAGGLLVIGGAALVVLAGGGEHGRNTTERV